MAHQPTPKRRRIAAQLLLVWLFALSAPINTFAHPLGNFTINAYTRIEPAADRIGVRYVVDMAEIPTFQELQKINPQGDGTPASVTAEMLDAYAARVAALYALGLRLTVDDTPVPLRVAAQHVSLPLGNGNLPTLRVECDLTGALPASLSSSIGGDALRVRFEDMNHAGRIGWHETIVKPTSGVAVFNCSAFGNDLTNELRAYPENMLSAPLDERAAELSYTFGNVPSGAMALRTRDGHIAPQTRDRFTELISTRELTPSIALLALVIAFGLGALHAFSPGHGKAVVGAYLVGSRGTPRHAMFLGLTVTVTHTIGVFALGVITLFASSYILPETIFPVLSFVSGAIVVFIGFSLFARRLHGALNSNVEDKDTHADSHAIAVADHEHDSLELNRDDFANNAAKAPAYKEEGFVHSHGGRVHSHLPPGTSGERVTWRSLLALGVTGGLLPCPSALVVLLSAISLHRIGFGMFLIIAFSLGLASTLTGVGLAFLYAGRMMKRPLRSSFLTRVLPVVSAFVIACLGLLICYEAVVQAGFNPVSSVSALVGQRSNETIEAADAETASLGSLGAFAVLGLGLVFGLKHATEVDHVVAVSTIVSEHRNLFRAAVVGGLWGLGHTASLVVVGTIVLFLRIAIPEHVANWLEFGVALMIIGLGVSAFLRAVQRRGDVHIHKHLHTGGAAHTHIHFHEEATVHDAPVPVHGAHAHAVSRVGVKPFLVGAMHGLAGSAALTLLVLTQINSVPLGLLYLAIFGVGSIFGMLLMSGLIGLPFALTSRKLAGTNYGLQLVAGVLSIAFGLWYAYETGISSGLLRTLL